MAAPRTTISLLPELRSLVDQPVPSGDSLSQRLNTLAGRYFAIVASELPNLDPAQWAHVVNLAHQIDLTRESAPTSLLGLIRMSKGEGNLGYQAESLSTAKTVAIMHVAERARMELGEGPYTVEQMQQWAPKKKASLGAP